MKPIDLEAKMFMLAFTIDARSGYYPHTIVREGLDEVALTLQVIKNTIQNQLSSTK